MKLYTLELKGGTPHIQGPFASDGDRIIAAREFLFTADLGDYIFRLQLDHNQEPVVTEFADDELDGEDDGYTHAIGDGFSSEELDAEV